MKLRKETINILKRLDIKILYVFGSSVTKTQNDKSDIDIGVVFGENSNPNYHISFIYLYKALTNEFRNKEIDIVFLNNAPLTLKFNVVIEGKIVYKDSTESENNFKERVIKEYIDFKPLLDQNEELILERIWRIFPLIKKLLFQD